MKKSSGLRTEPPEHSSVEKSVIEKLRSVLENLMIYDKKWNLNILDSSLRAELVDFSQKPSISLKSWYHIVSWT